MGRTVMTRRELTERELKILENIVRNFDYKKVVKVMKVLNWKWHGFSEVPTEIDVKERLREDIIKYCKQAIYLDEEEHEAANSGFHYLFSKHKGFIEFVRVEFVVTDTCFSDFEL